MSIVEDGAAAAAAQVAADTGLVGAGNSFRQASCPPSTHDADSSSSNESEGEILKARRMRKEKMKAKIEKKAEKLMMKRIKEEKREAFFLRVTSSSS
jgi:hypothetical protein